MNDRPKPVDFSTHIERAIAGREAKRAAAALRDEKPGGALEEPTHGIDIEGAIEPALVPVTADTLRADASNEGLRLPSRASLAALVPRAFDTDVDAVRFASATARVLGEEKGAVAEPAAVLAEITREQTDAEICAAFDAAWEAVASVSASQNATVAEANHRAALAVAKLVRRERGAA